MLWRAALLCLLLALDRSFVDPAALSGAENSRTTQQQQQDEEAQLISLKKPAAVSVEKSQVVQKVTNNGASKVHTDSNQRVSMDGHLLASLKHSVDTAPSQMGVALTSLDVPPLGVHQAIQATIQPPRMNQMTSQDLLTAQRRSLPELDMRGGQMSALDVAQYVFWTGDERGVSLAIHELINQGMMSREEAVLFLREIRQGLDALQAYYAQRSEQTDLLEASLRQKKTPVSSTQPPLMSEEEYSELLARLREADSIYTESSLQEIIYQLAKLLFSQSLQQGRGEAQASMRRFSELLQREVEQGRVTKALASKVLDVSSASLLDALHERPVADVNSIKH